VGANEQATGAESPSRPVRAVKAPAIALVVPAYRHAFTSVEPTIASSGIQAWSNQLFLGGTFVLPVGDAFGVRAGLEGGVGWNHSDSAFFSPDWVSGELGLLAEGFTRNPGVGELGVRFAYDTVFSERVDADWNAAVGGFGTLYVGRFDLGLGLDYLFGLWRPPDFPPFTPSETKDSGFGLDAFVRWYPLDSVSLALGVEYTITHRDTQSLGAPFSFDAVSVGPDVRVAWLPPICDQRIVSLEGGFRYRSNWSNPATGGITLPDRRADAFGGDVLIRLHWPGLASLIELNREY